MSQVGEKENKNWAPDPLRWSWLRRRPLRSRPWRIIKRHALHGPRRANLVVAQFCNPSSLYCNYQHKSRLSFSKAEQVVVIVLKFGIWSTPTACLPQPSKSTKQYSSRCVPISLVRMIMCFIMGSQKGNQIHITNNLENLTSGGRYITSMRMLSQDDEGTRGQLTNNYISHQ